MSENSVYAINEDLYCFWSASRRHSATDFLKSLDPGYFAFVADQGAACLGNTELETRAAASMRIAFFHGTETLLLLLGAFVQGPACPQAWIGECKTPQLREVMRKITVGEPLPVFNERIAALSWNSIAEAVLRGSGQPRAIAIAPKFESFWRRLAEAYLNDDFSDEYNGLKHGFRVGHGGIAAAISNKPSDGSIPAEEDMTPLGSSKWGTSFKVIRRAGSDAKANRSRYSVDHYINWDAEHMMVVLHCISASIHNVVAALQVAHGATAATFKVPDFGDSEFPMELYTLSMAYDDPPADARATNHEQLAVAVNSPARRR